MRNAILIIGLIVMILTPFFAWHEMWKVGDIDAFTNSKEVVITREQINVLKNMKGIGQPTTVRFTMWLSNALFKGDFGIFKDSGKSIPMVVLMLIASLLSGIAALFALKKPLVSLFIFLASTVLCFLSGLNGVASYIFVVILLALVILSYFGNRELQKEKPKPQEA